jgi:hypothetical protein
VVQSVPTGFTTRLGGADVSGRRTYDLVDEPLGDDYRALLRSATAHCDMAVLSVDTGRELSDKGRQVLAQLDGDRRSETQSGTLRRLRYALSPACLQVLGDAPGLYAWCQPERPENLCLLRSDGSPWMVSIAADRIAYLELTPFEKLLVGRSAPALAAVLAHQGARDAILAALEGRLEAEGERLQAELLAYARTTLSDGREGLVGALRDWLVSGELVRIVAAVHVAQRVGLTELLPELIELEQALERDLIPRPPVYRNGAVLRARWRTRFGRQLSAAVTELQGGSGGPV